MSACVGIFLDYNSCPNKDIQDLSGVLRSLRTYCAQHGSVTLFKAYLRLLGKAYYSDRPGCPRAEMDEAGVITVENPMGHLGVLATDVFCFLLDHRGSPDSKTVVLVSGNPHIAYLVTALRARHVKVGLVASLSDLDKILSQASWTKSWESFLTSTDPLNIAKGVDDCLLPSAATEESNSSVKSTSDHSLVDVPSAQAPSTGIQYSTPSAVQTKPETCTSSEELPAPLLPNFEYKVTNEKVREPLEYLTRILRSLHDVSTTSHKLRISEDDTLYFELLKDPEAFKIKSWRRELKNLYFCQDILKNPQVAGKLDALFTLLEEYDKMSKNYLAFSGIGRLLTQIAKFWINSNDYRQPYQARAIQLLIKWEPLASGSEDLSKSEDQP
ncbi:NYN domain [Rhizoctonia solani]|uniref:NYN domain n=1 Tax=Rhizoctonia solani TaxID=456999 RepID=A0A8H7LLM0_9AGAM|nr:NYN domain [Rhizoctonia solani]